jgi:hypothetical protein
MVRFLRKRTFQLQLPVGVSLVSFATDGIPGDINGTTVTGATLASGVDEGDLAANGARCHPCLGRQRPIGSTIAGPI